MLDNLLVGYLYLSTRVALQRLSEAFASMQTHNSSLKCDSTLNEAAAQFFLTCHVPPHLFNTLSCVCVFVVWLKAKFLFQSCSECTEPTLAQSLCTLCNKWLCYQCTDVHQHLRTPNTSQYMESHQQQRPSATQFPELHQRGSSSLPPTGQGKTLVWFVGFTDLYNTLLYS